MNDQINKKLGIVGGGQLGRFLAIAARELGFETVILDPTENSPAGQVADKQIVGGFDDPDMIQRLADEVDMMTFEFESVHAGALEELAVAGKHIQPTPKTLSIIRDKYQQKEFLVENSIPVAPFTKVTSKDDVVTFAEIHNYPLVLKARFGSYDGYGNADIKVEDDIDNAFEKLAGRDLYVEAYVPFVKELAVIAVRSLNGDIKTYPVVETIHEDHICDTVIAPAPVNDEIKSRAEDLATKVMDVFGGAGVFGIEMFLTKEGDVLINEIAPRVHNSGHFSLDGSQTSQFEQHVRAVTGMPLADTDMKGKQAVMINILGDRKGSADPQGVKEAINATGAHVHIYGKHETKPRRKMGHLTVVGDDLNIVLDSARQARKMINI